MKLSSFLVGMITTAMLVAFGTLTLGGTVLSAVMMWFATLMVAQIAYVVLLVVMARVPDDGAYPRWPEGGAASVFGRQGELSDKAAKPSVSRNA